MGTSGCGIFNVCTSTLIRNKLPLIFCAIFRQAQEIAARKEELQKLIVQRGKLAKKVAEHEKQLAMERKRCLAMQAEIDQIEGEWAEARKCVRHRQRAEQIIRAVGGAFEQRFEEGMNE